MNSISTVICSVFLVANVMLQSVYMNGLEIYRIEPLDDITFRYSFSPSLGGNVLAMAGVSCSSLYRAQVEEKERQRCIIQLIHTIRDEYLLFLSSFKLYSHSLHNSVQLLTLMYAYYDSNIILSGERETFSTSETSSIEDTLYSAELLKKQHYFRTCIYLGNDDVEYLSLLTALSSHQIESMWVFLNLPSQISSSAIYEKLFDHAKKANKTIDFFINKNPIALLDDLVNLHWSAGLKDRPLCDIVHVIDAGDSADSGYPNHFLHQIMQVFLLKNITTEDYFSKFSPRLILWERSYILRVNLLDINVADYELEDWRDNCKYCDDNIPIMNISACITCSGYLSANGKPMRLQPNNISLWEMNNLEQLRSVTGVKAVNRIRLEWLMSSVWPYYCGVLSQRNFDGMTGRHFSFASGTHHYMRELLIGRLSFESKPIDSKETFEDVGSNDEQFVIVISYTIRVFSETALGLKRALERIGRYESVIVLPDLTVDVMISIERLTGLSTSQNVLQIALGPHDVTFLLPKYIVFQMEQVWSPSAFRPNLHYRYALVLSHAQCIFTYSYVHSAMLHRLAYPCVRTLPFMYSQDPELYRKPHFRGVIPRLNQSSNEDTNYNLDGKFLSDVLFFGSCSPRRIAIIKELRQYFIQPVDERSNDEVQFLFGDDNLYTLRVLCGSWKTAVFDAVRFGYVSGARIVLNLHGDIVKSGSDVLSVYDSSESANQMLSVLEVHRINYLLSMGKCVVSEKGGDAELSSRYKDAVHFLPEFPGNKSTSNNVSVHEWGYEIAQVLLNLLNDSTQLKSCEQRGWKEYVRLSENVSVLSDVMAGVEKRATQQMRL